MTALIYSEEYRNHNTGSHPENQERLEAIVNSLKSRDIWDNLDIVNPQAASEDDILMVHTQKHLNHIKKLCENGGGYIDYDTYASPQSYNTALLAAGGAIKAADLALNNEINAYSIARPPGHHATRDRAMGFCIFNNMAISLEYLRKKYKVEKFLILDFDVHYGNGTAEIFYEDPNVLYISIHQNPRTIFPGKGFVEENGAGKGEGYNLNIPMAPGSTTDDYIYMLEKILGPVASKFNADFYFLDVGFDGHVNDPLSSLALTDDFYEYIIAKMKLITKSMALILEGGYNLDVLGRCNVKMVNALNNINVEDIYKDELKVRDANLHTYNQIKDIFSPYFEW